MPPLTPQQKLRIAVLGAAFVAQGIAVCRLAAIGASAANAADGLLAIVNKHSDTLDVEDLQELADLNL